MLAGFGGSLPSAGRPLAAFVAFPMDQGTEQRDFGQGRGFFCCLHVVSAGDGDPLAGVCGLELEKGTRGGAGERWAAACCPVLTAVFSPFSPPLCFLKNIGSFSLVSGGVSR